MLCRDLCQPPDWHVVSMLRSEVSVSKSISVSFAESLSLPLSWHFADALVAFDKQTPPSPLGRQGLGALSLSLKRRQEVDADLRVP